MTKSENVKMELNEVNESMKMNNDEFRKLSKIYRNLECQAILKSSSSSNQCIFHRTTTGCIYTSCKLFLNNHRTSSILFFTSLVVQLNVLK